MSASKQWATIMWDWACYNRRETASASSSQFHLVWNQEPFQGSSSSNTITINSDFSMYSRQEVSLTQDFQVILLGPYLCESSQSSRSTEF